MTGAGCDKRKITNEPITKSNTNMKTADQIEPTPGVASGRGLNPRTADVSLSPQREQATDKNTIRPLRVTVPEAELTELRRRINATKWPERETVTDATQGVQLATMQALARYWAHGLRLAQIEARLNALPQFHHRNRWAGHSFHSRSFET